MKEEEQDERHKPSKHTDPDPKPNPSPKTTHKSQTKEIVKERWGKPTWTLSSVTRISDVYMKSIRSCMALLSIFCRVMEGVLASATSLVNMA